MKKYAELSLGCWLSGHTCIKFRLPGRQGIHVSSFVFHSVFLCQLHAHTCPLYNALLEVVCCCFPILTLYKHDVCRGHKLSSQVSCLSVLRLVRYTS